MRRELEHAIEDQRASLEKDITPVPPIVLDDVVSLGLDPEIECDQRNAADPPESVTCPLAPLRNVPYSVMSYLIR